MASAPLTKSRLVLLASVAALGSLAMHMLIPALPAIAHEMRVGQATAQLVVAIYLAGLGLGQLIAGPLSDMLGRKSVLLTGLALFCIASLLAYLAPGMEVLLVARFAQALGGAAGVVSARALISDMSRGHEATGHIATLTTVVLLSPLVAPSIGGAIAGWTDWRFIFVVLAGAGLASAGLAWLRLPAGGVRHVQVSFGALVTVYRRLALNGRFRRYAFANACASGALYVFLSSSPFLLIGKWGLDPEEAGLCYLAVTSAGVVGTLFVRRLEARGGAFRLGLGAMAVGGGVMFVVAALGLSGPAYLLLPMFIVCGGSGIAAPAGIAGAMHAEAGVAGTASSVAGAFQMLMSAVVSAAVSAVGAGSFLMLATSLLVASLLGLIIAPAGRSIIGTLEGTP